LRENQALPNICDKAALIFPFTSLANIFGFVSLPMSFLMILGIIIVLYILTAELAKKYSIKR